LYRPLEVTITPIGVAYVESELLARHPDAQAYQVRLVTTISDQWSEPGSKIWINRPKRPAQCLGGLKLNTDPSNFALGLKEFAGVYQAQFVLAVA
jgi:hypothetical protein